MSLMDLTQNEEIENLEKKVKRLERQINGGNLMSKIISDLVGRDCIIDGDEIYDEKCRVEDFEIV